jgi:arylsulfatase A-like enzyme
MNGLSNNDIFTELAMHWIDHNKNEPFFLWLQWLRPHAPYEPPKAFLNRFETSYTGIADGSLSQIKRISNKELQLSEEDQKHYEALYDGEVAASDHEIGRIIEQLESLDLLKNSLLIITSDHGENLYEHDMEYGHYGVYDSSIRIPLIFTMPGVLPKNGRISHVVQSIDIAPTILSVLGIKAPDQFQGRNLGPLIQGESSDWNSIAYSMMFRDNRNFFALRKDDWKIILDSRAHGKEFELYHIPTDPDEENNLFKTEHRIADSLKQNLTEWIEQEFGNVELAYTPGKILKKEFDEQTIERLRSLGYIK